MEPLYKAIGILPTAADEISLYVVRNYTFPTVHLERMVVRTDGFVSAHAGYEDGELLTKPIVFEGDNLVLNFATSAAGRERSHAKATSAKPLRRIAGKPVRLRFVMKDADLYSLGFR